MEDREQHHRKHKYKVLTGVRHDTDPFLEGDRVTLSGPVLRQVIAVLEGREAPAFTLFELNLETPLGEYTEAVPVDLMAVPRLLARKLRYAVDGAPPMRGTVPPPPPPLPR